MHELLLIDALHVLTLFFPNRFHHQVGVFVSIVSTKIPFKGAGKEYIGDDIEEMVAAVKHAIQACGLQVRRQFRN